MKAGFIVGLPGAGKTEGSKRLIERLDRSGYTTLFLKDKTFLEEQVLKDMREHGKPRGDGAMVGKHSVLLNPGGAPGTLLMEFIDGHALNTAHKELMGSVARLLKEEKKNTFLLVEWAYGADYPYTGEPLVQEGRHFVQLLRDHRLLGQVPVLDIVANFKVRVDRNEHRSGHIPTSEFVKYFPEQGHFRPEDVVAMGATYNRVENYGTSKKDLPLLYREMDHVFDTVLTPYLGEGSRTHKEGAPRLPRKER